MLRKLHRQMTFFCALITGIILCALSLACLFFSESAMRQSHYQSFLNDMNSVLSYLEDQTVISEQWLAKTESNQKLMIALYDNGHAFNHNSLASGSRRNTLLEQAAALSASEYGLDIFQPAYNQVLTQSQEFSMHDEAGGQYYAATAVFPRGSGYLSAVMVSPLADLEQQIFNQRILFAVLDLAGIGILTLFSWLFTARMLRPVEESRQKQARFVAAASHELRTPLAVILSSLSALKMAEGTERECFEDNIEAEGLRMSRLVDDMLSLASTDSKSWSICPGQQDMDTLLLELYERFQPLYRNCRIGFSLSLPEESLPRWDCDKARIQQALSVLLDNALCYTPEGGQVTLQANTQNGRLKISVIDNGPGVPDEQKDLIFQRFYRGDGSHDAKEHFGLGLCVAKEIALLHKGQLWVEDAPGGGAVFSLVI